MSVCTSGSLEGCLSLVSQYLHQWSSWRHLCASLDGMPVLLKCNVLMKKAVLFPMEAHPFAITCALPESLQQPQRRRTTRSTCGLSRLLPQPPLVHPPLPLLRPLQRCPRGPPGPTLLNPRLPQQLPQRERPHLGRAAAVLPMPMGEMAGQAMERGAAAAMGCAQTAAAVPAPQHKVRQATTTWSASHAAGQANAASQPSPPSRRAAAVHPCRVTAATHDPCTSL